MDYFNKIKLKNNQNKELNEISSCSKKVNEFKPDFNNISIKNELNIVNFKYNMVKKIISTKILIKLK